MTKKLVTILAEEMPVWPEGGVRSIGQTCSGALHFDGAFGHLIRHSNLKYTICDDIYENKVTRAQWEAERARILLDSQPERDPFIKELVEIACKTKRLPDVNDIDVADLNQALWDKVAIASTQAFITAHVTHFGHENVWESKELVSCAADYADALMAERAKRMEGKQ